MKAFEIFRKNKNPPMFTVGNIGGAIWSHKIDIYIVDNFMVKTECSYILNFPKFTQRPPWASKTIMKTNQL